jgi:E3 ubiquitin-protein ligase HUWE1
LADIDSWKWPRSDLNAWTKVLDKFDVILEEAIRDYEVDKLQINVFTPATKKTISHILRFERLLLENSTNRKTFNSYDVRPFHSIIDPRLIVALMGSISEA